MATSGTRKSRDTGAVALGGQDERKRGGGWLKWLLPLALLAALAIVLIALLGGGDDDRATTGTGTGTSAGAITAGGTTLHGDDPGTLTGAIGEQATGQDVRVLSVIKGVGFWVGTSQQDRMFVEYGSKAGGDETQQTFQAKVGQRVNLAGPVQKAPADPEQTLRISGQDAQRVTEQGAFINADRVSGA